MDVTLQSQIKAQIEWRTNEQCIEILMLALKLALTTFVNTLAGIPIRQRRIGWLARTQACKYRGGECKAYNYALGYQQFSSPQALIQNSADILNSRSISRNSHAFCNNGTTYAICLSNSGDAWMPSSREHLQ